ncbi:MAG: amino acid ABC transporter ATP-binding protein [Planctomycetota bacterium]|jgi:polar amino acid transport system ATP-binding protein|nr:amino acid ABC transporter ATP-binding protein [Planctomycetota bacterium]
MPPLINADGIHKSFGGMEVLRGTTLRVDEGEVAAVIGRSGSGKSTLLRILNGLETCDAGFLSVDGERISGLERDLRRLRLKVGMVFQQFNLFPHLTAGENVMLAPRAVKRLSRPEAKSLAGEMLAGVGLADRFDAFPDQLSGGQQQRVAIARALAMRPRVLLCDEITSALDPELVGEVLEVVRKLAAAGMTLVLVTHEMRFAREVCDRLVFMHNGVVGEEGKPAELFSRPQTPELAAFIGQAGQGSAGR